MNKSPIRADRGLLSRSECHALRGLAILGITAAVAGISARRIYAQLGGEPDYAAEVTRTIASGDLGQTISSAPRGSVLAGLAEEALCHAPRPGAWRRAHVNEASAAR